MYICSNCSKTYTAWRAICNDCGQAGTVDESKQEVEESWSAPLSMPPQIVDVARIVTGVSEFDRVIGGGLVPGQVVAFHAPPGTGKSTLAAQVLSQSGLPVLYATAEESANQVFSRHKRVGVKDNVKVLATTTWENVEAYGKDYSVVVLDSLQTFCTSTLDSRPGTPSQTETVCALACKWAKEHNIALIIIVQVTKENIAAGPQTIAHMVDTLIQLIPPSTGSQLTLLESEKNRYGPTGEIGIFTHTSQGLKEVPNPEDYLTSTHKEEVSGCCRTILKEGRRYMLAEIQALVVPSVNSQPKRVVGSGIDKSRLELILAVLEAKGYESFLGLDVFVTTVGGARLKERSSDLAIATALISAARNLTEIDLCVGELYLTGEIAKPSDIQGRQKYGEKLGFEIKTQL